MPATERSQGVFWAAPLAEIMASLHTSADGLTTAEAEAGVAIYGANQIEDVRRSHWLRPLLVRFGNPLIVVLLFAAAVSAVTRDPQSFVLITTIVVVSVLIDFVQERRADQPRPGCARGSRCASGCCATARSGDAGGRAGARRLVAARGGRHRARPTAGCWRRATSS